MSSRCVAAQSAVRPAQETEAATNRTENRSAVVAYVCDQGRLHQLLVSIASWRRFGAWPICIVDLGLTERGREAVDALVGDSVTFCARATSFVPHDAAEGPRLTAYVEKTLVGAKADADVVVFLDSDIVVVGPDTIDHLASAGAGELLASPSAWDRDFTWTYRDGALVHLRRLTEDPDLRMASPICNSGVWSMRRDDAAVVSKQWAAAYVGALRTPDLWAQVRPGALIGDQEFLVPAGRSVGVAWRRLHGSFNMQVHENRMPWHLGRAGHPLGGHACEEPEPVRAIHYGCAVDGTVVLDADMIGSSDVRRWIRDQYADCWTAASRALAGAGFTGVEKADPRR